MTMATKNLFQEFLDQIRIVIREEISRAGNEKNPLSGKDWLTAKELSELYGLPQTFFEERGRAGDIQRAKPGRNVIFNRRDVEAYLEKHKG
jgi:excisionase family DNA binding protein